ncbi:hypothetical protein NEA10_19535 [Phormidium yuhuli AB48]|uniref:PIN domain-containing protein n=1 Tax=Phormidium yuhuli AB48 TaxID=2940671 RepID=A0ABY5AP71_9CYAN|nr:hypothetical protein [Phormidium yuhuli]USR90988.1 hypothetical protein NEA10_19535 [Phormidium yuhuli AB48]
MSDLMDKNFIDSNIWLYRLLDDPKLDPQDYQSKRLIAIDLTQPSDRSLVISTQVITETCAVLKRKTQITNEEILEKLPPRTEGMAGVPEAMRSGKFERVG